MTLGMPSTGRGFSGRRADRTSPFVALAVASFCAFVVVGVSSPVGAAGATKPTSGHTVDEEENARTPFEKGKAKVAASKSANGSVKGSNAAQAGKVQKDGKVLKDGKVQIIDVEMTAVFYKPRSVVVTAGRPVRFRFKNSSNLVHEALIGDESAQRKHEKEMRAIDKGEIAASRHDGHREGFVSVASGATSSLDWTFARPGKTIIGCHVPGHYDQGMKLTVVIKPASALG